jgi:hypothetical protein
MCGLFYNYIYLHHCYYQLKQLHSELPSRGVVRETLAILQRRIREALSLWDSVVRTSPSFQQIYKREIGKKRAACALLFIYARGRKTSRKNMGKFAVFAPFGQSETAQQLSFPPKYPKYIYGSAKQ